MRWRTSRGGLSTLTNFFDREGDQTVVNIHVASNLHNLGDVLVVEPQDLLVTLLHVLVIQSDLDRLPLLEFNLSSTTLRAEEEESVSPLKEQEAALLGDFPMLPQNLRP